MERPVGLPKKRLSWADGIQAYRNTGPRAASASNSTKQPKRRKHPGDDDVEEPAPRKSRKCDSSVLSKEELKELREYRKELAEYRKELAEYRKEQAEHWAKMESSNEKINSALTDFVETSKELIADLSKKPTNDSPVILF